MNNPDKLNWQKIKVVLSDVDGVLTDGGLYYTEDGLVMKKFNVKDGMGVRMLQTAGIKSGIISTDVSKLMVIRAERLNMDFCFVGIHDKKNKVEEICKEEGIELENIAFIGDDINDIEIIKSAGIGVCPKNAAADVIDVADYISSRDGGHGVFREIAEMILNSLK